MFNELSVSVVTVVSSGFWFKNLRLLSRWFVLKVLQGLCQEF